MHWLVMLSVAIFALTLARTLQHADEVYGLAVRGTGFFSALWAFAAAPPFAQLALILFAFGWLQFESPRA